MDLLGLPDGETEWRSDPRERALREVATVAGLPADVACFKDTQIAAFQDFLRKKADSRRLDTSPASKNGIYRPLPDAHSIRVLDLQPSGSFSAPLHCSLRPVSVEFEYPSVRKEGSRVESKPETIHAIDLATGKPAWYTALSYLWGPPDFSCEVWVHHEATGNTIGTSALGSNKGQASSREPRRHAITLNLDAAMRHLRDAEHTVTLWIDQICIDQADNVEKSNQIALMSLIYRRALNTSIWLGSESDNIGDPSTGAFEILRTIRHAFNLTLDISDPTMFEAVQLPCSRQDAYKALAAMFRRPWFGRVWVIQEVILSRRRIVRCGQGTQKRAIDWEDFGSASMTAVESGFLDWLRAKVTTEVTPAEEEKDVGGTQVGVSDYAAIRRGVEIARELHATSVNMTDQLNGPAPMPWSLILMLADTRYADATNPCDKIYGVLALVADKILVDYTIPASVVYHRAMLTIIGTAAPDSYKLHRIFSCVDHEPMTGMPSWVPDWSRPRVTGPIGFSSMTAGIYKASSDLPGKNRLKISEDGRTIFIAGRLIDTIEDLTESWTEPGDMLPGAGQGSSYAAIAAFVKQYELQSTDDEDEFDVLWKTLIVGKDATGRTECPSSYREVFEKVMHPPKLHMQLSAPINSLVADSRHKKSRGKPKKEKPARPERLRAWERLLSEVQSACLQAITNRRICITQGKHLTLAPGRTKRSDVVAIFANFPVPFVIRPHGDGRYQLIGECYAHGVMRGQKYDSNSAVQLIEIV